MPYEKTNWTNGVTPINETNMSKIENQIEENTSDIDVLKSFFNLEYKMVGTKKFVKLVEQNLSKYRTYFSANRNCLFQLSSNSYSILGLIDTLTYQEGIYEFIYEDVTNNRSNQWSQTSNPIFTSTPTGYTPINIASSTNWGTGLRKQSNSCYIDGCTGTSWWWCVCTYADYQGGMPGSASSISQHIRLWLRVE